MITNPVAIFSALYLVVFGMIWLERFKNFRKLGASSKKKPCHSGPAVAGLCQIEFIQSAVTS